MAAKTRNIQTKDGIIYVRIAVPKSLRAEIGKTELRRSLGSDKTIARRRYPAVLAEFERALADAREKIGRSKPPRRLMTDDEAANLHYHEELAIDQRVRRLPVTIDTIDLGTVILRTAHSIPRQNALFSDALRKLLRRVVSGDTTDEETASCVGWVIEDFEKRGLIDVERGSFEWRKLAQMFAAVELEAWKRRDERDRGDPDGEPTYKPLTTPPLSDLDAEAVPLSELFAGYIAELKRSGRGAEAAKRWKPCFADLIAFLKHDDARRLTKQDVARWKDRLLETRAPKTVRDVHLSALKTVLTWAVENGKLAENVAVGVKVRVSKPNVGRERGFTDAEALAILNAAIGHAPVLRDNAQTTEKAFLTAAKRWVPLLCAFTGARVAEMTQLRRRDVLLDAEIPYLRISPEAGSTKTGEYRDVPIHPQLVELGFREFVNSADDGPLFFDVSRKRKGASHPSKQVAGRLTEWLGGLGVIPDGVQPNHGWRHRFKTVAIRLGIEGRVADAIQGHAARTAGENYGSVELGPKYEAIKRFPRFAFEK